MFRIHLPAFAQLFVCLMTTMQTDMILYKTEYIYLIFNRLFIGTLQNADTDGWMRTADDGRRTADGGWGIRMLNLLVNCQLLRNTSFGYFFFLI